MVGLMMITFVAVLFVSIGIAQYKSKKPVGFYTGEKPPKIEDLTDVKAWNHRHALAWILYGVSLFISYNLGFFLNEMGFSVLMCMITIGGVIILCAYHSLLRAKYMK